MCIFFVLFKNKSGSVIRVSGVGARGSTKSRSSLGVCMIVLSMLLF